MLRTVADRWLICGLADYIGGCGCMWVKAAIWIGRLVVDYWFDLLWLIGG